jgi:hypothetical protein
MRSPMPCARRQPNGEASAAKRAIDLPTRLSGREKLLLWRLKVSRWEKEPLLTLYAASNDEQKRIADQLMFVPSGMAS